MKGFMRRRGSSWELRAYLGRDPISGRKRYATRSVRGLRRDAERMLREMVAAAEAGATHRAGATFGELCEEWFAHGRSYLALPGAEHAGRDPPHPRQRPATPRRRGTAGQAAARAPRRRLRRAPPGRAQ